MTARSRVGYTSGDEDQGLPRRTGAPAPTRCPAPPRRVLGRRDRRVPRDLDPVGPALARLVPGPRPGGPGGSPGTGPATQAHRHPGEDRPSVAGGSPVEHGFATELWTARRLARLIEEELAIRFDPRSLAGWLRDRGSTPRKPERVPRGRDPGAIAAWLASDQEGGQAPGGAPGPDRRERPDDGPAGPPRLGAPGPDAIPGPGRRPPREGLRRGGVVAAPAPRPPGVVLPHAGRRRLRRLVRDGLPGGGVARPAGPVRGHLGRRPDAQGRADPRAGGPLRRPAEPGAVAAVRAGA